MYLENFHGRIILKSELLDNAFFTTRDCPLKLSPDVEANKHFICENLDVPYENLIIPEQTHSDHVAIAEIGKEFPDTDALITDNPNIVIALNFADCVPVILYDPIKKIAAIAHAGWRGTAKQIAVKTLQKMGSTPKDVIALIGPAIGKCCYKVGQEVLSELGIDNSSDGKIDLKMINKNQLFSNGVEKIDVCDYCTCCEGELFYSYRRTFGDCARHSAVIKIED